MIKALLLSSLALLMAVSCTTSIPIAEENGTTILPTESAATEVAQPTSEEVNIEITPLTFGGQGDTFLAAIEQARGEAGVPVAHRYVEMGGDAQKLWQGEALHYADQTVLYLQRLQSGGDHAMRVEISEADTDLTDAALLAALDAAEVAPGRDTGAVDVDILFVRARLSGDSVWNFDVRLNHPDTGWEDYVDGWHVESESGEILGTRILLHPHDAEMPFSRSLSGVAIPADAPRVYIRTHDLISGYSDDRLALPLSEAASTEQYEIVR